MSENRQPDSARARAHASANLVSREALEARLATALDVLEGIIQSETNPAKLAHVTSRYAETVVRALATLHPAKQQLELSKAPEWETLTPQERLQQIASQRELLAVMEHETTLLLPETSGQKTPEE